MGEIINKDRTVSVKISLDDILENGSFKNHGISKFISTCMAFYFLKKASPELEQQVPRELPKDWKYQDGIFEIELNKSDTRDLRSLS